MDAADPPPRSSTPVRAVLAACVFTAALGVAARAGAENAGKAAAAEALFEQATALMDQGEYEKACQRFEGSLELDAALGTMLRLADCYDRVGKTASAWSMFRDAASVARERQEVEREQIASVRAADAERRLPKLKLVIAQNDTPGLSVRLNGQVLPRASYDVELPVDPGAQRIDATAEGRVPWSASVDVPRGPGTREVVVPALAPAPPTPSKPLAAQSSRAPRFHEPGAFYTDAFGDALLIAGIAAGGVGTYFVVKGNDDLHEAANAGVYRDYDATAKRGERDQVIGAAAAGAGGLLVATAVIRYLTRGSAHPENAAWLVDAHGIAYRGRF